MKLPEWLQIVIVLVITVLLTCILWALVESEKPVFYITRIADYPPPMEGTGGYIIEWTKNGENQMPAEFNTAEERDIFAKYLSTSGRVVR